MTMINIFKIMTKDLSKIKEIKKLLNKLIIKEGLTIRQSKKMFNLLLDIK